MSKNACQLVESLGNHWVLVIFDYFGYTIAIILYTLCLYRYISFLSCLYIWYSIIRLNRSRNSIAHNLYIFKFSLNVLACLFIFAFLVLFLYSVVWTKLTSE